MVPCLQNSCQQSIRIQNEPKMADKHVPPPVLDDFSVPSWTQLKPSWAMLGPSWRYLGRTWGLLGSTLGLANPNLKNTYFGKRCDGASTPDLVLKLSRF